MQQIVTVAAVVKGLINGRAHDASLASWEDLLVLRYNMESVYKQHPEPGTEWQDQFCIVPARYVHRMKKPKRLFESGELSTFEHAYSDFNDRLAEMYDQECLRVVVPSTTPQSIRDIFPSWSVDPLGPRNAADVEYQYDEARNAILDLLEYVGFMESNRRHQLKDKHNSPLDMLNEYRMSLRQETQARAEARERALKKHDY